ncbi:nicotinamide riboside transporter PnuC [Paraferrimonas haliotis]|uniref:Nicotinamide riboside transporter PnuC n=1 Tax=Paraferrimonas haliotis TaxID=2013866 RepID=A0AA37TUF7_9GAMM|nr:nicotinamide riboside transporter PnuC [Paraferrimonas haliotis]GLS84702.1 nicotinamide mononucleotide transporter [Paraferrimonas haliotis]
MEWLASISADAQAMSLWESIAVALAVVYLVGAMNSKLWCWPAAFVSTLIYTVLFWKVALLMESLLNVYYMAMAVYGFWMWRYGGGSQTGVAMVSWSLSRHLQLIAVTAVVALALGYVMSNYTHADFAYLDAATTTFAVMTTVLVALKVIENWLYWVVIDLVSIYLYVSKGFMLTSALFVFYTVLAFYSYWVWRKAYLQQEQGNCPNTLTAT